MELRDASAQVLVVSLVCFCCPGLFNALSSIASGLSDPAVAYAGNAVVCACFASSSLLASSLLARGAVSVRSALALGTIGYVLYSGSLSSLNQADSPSPLQLRLFYAACAALGLSAGFLWTAQGLVVMGYATKETQGQFLGVFWIIFNLGAVAGGLVSFIVNVESEKDASSHPSSAMYAVFLALMAAGSVLAICCILRPEQVIKSDGRPVKCAVPAARCASESNIFSRDFRHERLTVGKITAVALLLPLFAYSNWFYTYHSLFNVSLFNNRTGGLSCASYWLAQMAAAHFSGRSLDRYVKQLDAASQDLEREPLRTDTPVGGETISLQLHHGHIRVVATHSLLQLAALSNVMWAIGWCFQLSTHRITYGNRDRLDVVADFPACIPPFLLYMLYGWHDAQCQVWVYWFLSNMAGRDPAFCAQLAGIYKSVQAVSASASWLVGAMETAPLVQLGVNWGLCDVALVGAWLAIEAFTRISFKTKPNELDELLPRLT